MKFKLTSSWEKLFWEIVWTVGVPPNDNGHGSDFITTGEVVVEVKAVEVNWLAVVVVASLKTPFWANCANWSEVSTKGAFGGGGSETLQRFRKNIFS